MNLMRDCTTHHYACDCRENIRKAIEYILNEAHLHPEDSVVDIANEAFEKLNFNAKWNGDDAWPVTVKTDNKQIHRTAN